MKSNQGLIRSHSSLLAALFRAMDILLILSALYLSALMLGVSWHDYFTIAGCIAILIYIITAEMTALYASWRLGSLFDENKQVIITWLAVVFVLLVIAYSTKTSAIYSRRVLLTWMIVTPIILSIFRIIARQVLRELRERDRNLRIAAIVAVSDAIVMSQLVNQVIYLVKADVTPYQLAQEGIRRLQKVHAPIVGIVLNQVSPPKKSARYGHYHGYYGYGKT